MEDAAGLGAILVMLFALGMAALGIALLLAPLMMVRRLREIRQVLWRLTMAVEAGGRLQEGRAEQRPPSAVSQRHLPS